MLTQYNMEISLIQATYTYDWVKYMLEGTESVDKKELGSKDLLTMTRVGIWDIRVETQMWQLTILIACILVKDKGDVGLDFTK
jgi:hypothetical protein